MFYFDFSSETRATKRSWCSHFLFVSNWNSGGNTLLFLVCFYSFIFNPKNTTKTVKKCNFTTVDFVSHQTII